MFAYGTRFLISAALAILKLLEQHLLTLSLGEINDVFKQLKEQNEHSNFNLLPDYESVIREARRINVSNGKINKILMDDLEQSFFKLVTPPNQIP